MSDKPLIQQKLAVDLAGLTNTIDAQDEDGFQAALAYLDGFWEMMGREWEGIDQLR
jgi:ribosomal RNA-processing protein 1